MYFAEVYDVRVGGNSERKQCFEEYVRLKCVALAQQNK